jgi:phospholipid/cholesterol/gamma-HCH transport system substrate-binding protein
VGALLLGTAALFVGLLAYIVGVSISGEHSRFVLLFAENVKGLVVGSKVNFQGVPVGAVSDIRFTDGLTRVEIAVDPTRAVVQEVTRGRLDRALVTGQVTVELEGYRAGAAPLPEGGVIESAPSALLALTKAVPDVVTDLGSVVLEAQQLIRGLNALVGGDSRERLQATLAHAEAASRDVPQQVSAAAAEVARAARELAPAVRAGLDEARGALGEVRGAAAEIGRTAAALRAVVERGDLEATLASARRGAAGLERVQDQLGRLLADVGTALATTRPALHRALAAAHGALVELQGLARTLRLAPSALLYGAPPRELSPGAAPGGGR